MSGAVEATAFQLAWLIAYAANPGGAYVMNEGGGGLGDAYHYRTDGMRIPISNRMYLQVRCTGGGFPLDEDSNNNSTQAAVDIEVDFWLRLSGEGTSMYRERNWFTALFRSLGEGKFHFHVEPVLDPRWWLNLSDVDDLLDGPELSQEPERFGPLCHAQVHAVILYGTG